MSSATAKHNNRLRRVLLDVRVMLQMFNARVDPDQFLQFPVTEKLPLGTEVLRVQYSFECHALEAIVTHPSFDIVPEFLQIPLHEESFYHVDSISVKDLLAKQGYKVEPLSIYEDSD